MKQYQYTNKCVVKSKLGLCLKAITIIYSNNLCSGFYARLRVH